MKGHIRVLFFVTFVAFAVNKLALRPWVLSVEGLEGLKLFSYSFPNFCEAVMGSILLSYMGLNLRGRYEALSHITERLVIYIASLLAAIYVLTQEFRIHNLGGNNIFDMNDVYASLIGLVLTNQLIIHTGLNRRSADEI